MTEIGFAQLGLAKIIAGVYAINKGSSALLKKNGFVCEGIKRLQFVIKEQCVDGLIYGKLRPEVERQYLMTQPHTSNLNFALMGAAGYIAPRHLEAIQANGGDLIAAMDPSDSVGILDRHFPNTQFLYPFERFERFVNKQKEINNAIDFISICSPNYLHMIHIAALPTEWRSMPFAKNHLS